MTSTLSQIALVAIVLIASCASAPGLLFAGSLAVIVLSILIGVVCRHPPPGL